MNNDIISTLTEARDDCAAGQSPRVSHDRLAQALTAVIKLFEGDSAEAGVLKDEICSWRGSGDLAEHDVKYIIPAMESGALALRALPKVMAEVERLRAALEMIAKYDDGVRDGICPYGCDTPNIARAALNEGANNG